MGRSTASICEGQSVVPVSAFIVSQPKAGTYLAVNILRELGYRFKRYHLSEKKYYRYPKPGDPAFRIALQDPRIVMSRATLDESIRKIAHTDEIGVGHLAYTPFNEQCLRPYKKILLTRPEKEILESVQRWEQYTGRPPSNPGNIKHRCRAVQNWRLQPDVFHMTFADMRECNVARIDQLQEFLEVEKKDSRTVVKRALAAPSKTKIPNV